MKERVEGLVAQLKENELDGVLISAEENRRYLSGFSGSAGYLFITAANAILATDSRSVSYTHLTLPTIYSV